MADIEIVRNPAMIAGEINLIRKQTEERVLAASIEIGRRLQEAKGMVPHGEWADWLNQNVRYSQSTADNLMRIAAEYGDEQISMFSGKAKSETFAKITYSQAIALFALPEPDRETFVETHDMESMSARDVQEEIRSIRTEAETAVKERDAAVKDAADAGQKVKALEKKIAKAENDTAEAVKAGIKAKADLEAAEAEKKALEQRIAENAEALQEARAEIAELKNAEVSQPSMDVTASEEAAAEAMEQMREQVRAEFAKKLENAADPNLHAFMFAYQAWSEAFDKLLEKIAANRPENREKLERKVLEMISFMKEKVGGQG